MRNVFTILILLSAAGWAQKPEDGWKGIKPLITTRAAVDKLLGEPTVDDNGYFGYQTGDAFVQMNFSSKPCLPNQYARGKYNVPENTVLGYSVRLKEIRNLSELKFDLTKYVREWSEHLFTSAYYFRYESGIRINVHIIDNVELVTGFNYSPANLEMERFRCKKI